ncbi:hypothetical protein J5N97_005959 [Dioscorea zingiberensis]|uniref:Secreted protein n=1 Tax=Dioscorea zingiberensis TaxID=325984 RepID=A0A9D5HSU0_9LILI|nr:hypothetical protein J5N97_005959 [Dioscorea zingiberensis]
MCPVSYFFCCKVVCTVLHLFLSLNHSHEPVGGSIELVLIFQSETSTTYRQLGDVDLLPLQVLAVSQSLCL